MTFNLHWCHDHDPHHCNEDGSCIMCIPLSFKILLEEILSPTENSDRNDEFTAGSVSHNYLEKKNLGGCCQQSTISMDEFDCAKNLLVRRLERLDEIIKDVGDHNLSSAHQKVLIADSYVEIMDHRRAVSYYEDSRNIYSNILGENCSEVININMKLGKSYYMNGDFEKSLKTYHQGLDMMANERENATNCER